VQRILGHVSIATTQVYQRVATELGNGSGTNGDDALSAVPNLQQFVEAGSENR
jgi:hypothetical protein